MNVFFSADWETASAASVRARRGVASSDSDTERGNEGGRKGEIYAVLTDRPREERKSGKRRDGRTDKRGLNSVAARFMSRGGGDLGLGGKDDTDDALSLGEKEEAEN